MEPTNEVKWKRFQPADNWLFDHYSVTDRWCFIMDYCKVSGDYSMKTPHCWHHTGEILTVHPPVATLICCHCGEKKRVEVPSTFHGIFKPMEEETCD